jgi:hypothetical protein
LSTITVIYHDPMAAIIDPATEDGQYVAFYNVDNNDPIPWQTITKDLETLRKNLKAIEGNGQLKE